MRWPNGRMSVSRCALYGIAAWSCINPTAYLDRKVPGCPVVICNISLRDSIRSTGQPRSFRIVADPLRKSSRCRRLCLLPIGSEVFFTIGRATPLFQEPNSALLQHFPWLLLVIPGVIHLFHRYKINGLGILLPIALTYGLYFEYNDFAPDNIFRFHLFHYLFWTFPLLALITYVGLKEAWKYRVGRWSFCQCLYSCLRYVL